jgi:predicted enzyme related to lactoylglutathione lyase
MNNQIINYRLFIFSENPDELMKFYRDVMGFEVTMELKLPDDYGYGFKVTDTLKLWIGKHSQIKGKTKEPFRHILNFYVPDVFAWYEKLKDRKDIEVIAVPFRSPHSSEEKPRYAFTFLDPEGNCLQFMNP